MPYELLDAIVPAVDLPEHSLRAGDIGSVVAVYGDEAVEVEFVTGTGNTQALLSLPLMDVRAISPNDIPAVRSLGSATAA